MAHSEELARRLSQFIAMSLWPSDSKRKYKTLWQGRMHWVGGKPAAGQRRHQGEDSGFENALQAGKINLDSMQAVLCLEIWIHTTPLLPRKEIYRYRYAMIWQQGCLSPSCMGRPASWAERAALTNSRHTFQILRTSFCSLLVSLDRTGRCFLCHISESDLKWIWT